VDLVSMKAIHPAMRSGIESEWIRAA
jgi:hypothetical protein